MINIFCALPCEARAIIHHYKLKHHPGSYLYSTYINKQQSISLTITGIGKQSATGGVIHAYMFLSASKSDGWVNIGIAGHATLEPGTPILATKIIDDSSGRCWYPQIVFNNTIMTETIMTVDKPTSKYQENNVIDMEASAFIESANKTGFIELSHSLKIISDNKNNSYKKISKTYVENLINSNLSVIDKLIEEITLLTEILKKSDEMDDVFNEIIGINHFTHSEQLILKKQLRRWGVLFPGSAPEINKIQKQLSSKNILNYLDDTLDNATINFKKVN
ncbi:MAG: 5'-methylthioadenosine/S-adenosylhomocysteine nucleosidase family protein [Gammaproteobacteria bacterium]|jgi:adenosylhomocysteine nucleosidase